MDSLWSGAGLRLALVAVMASVVVMGSVGCGGDDSLPTARDADRDVLADAMDTRETDDANPPQDTLEDTASDVMADPDATADADTDDPPPPSYPAVYPAGRTHSPITPFVARTLRDVAASSAASDDVFAKIGDSHTVSQNFMHCFGGSGVSLDGRDELQPTIDHFLQGDAAGTTPFERDSEAAVVGWSAVSMIDGSPSRFAQELDALDPRIGLVQFGTNDIGLRDIYGYHDAMAYMADELLSRGAIPVFTSIPPRGDDAEADAWVPRYNAVMRGIAQSRQFPFVDLHRELVDIPSMGLAGDGVHLNVYRPSGARPCDFTSTGLEYGNNVRNLLTIQALDRVRQVALAGRDAPDEPGVQRTGTGTADDPIQIDQFPFSDARDTRSGAQSELDVYDGCGADQDESGAEFLYRVELTSRARLRAFVFDRGTVDIDLHMLAGEPSTGACIERAHRTISGDFSPGIYYFALDTYVAEDGPRDGDYLFVLLRE